jgi:hypothetical protein
VQGSPERQALEEALKGERVGLPKIQALADYAMLKDIYRQCILENVANEGYSI